MNTSVLQWPAPLYRLAAISMLARSIYLAVQEANAVPTGRAAVQWRNLSPQEQENYVAVATEVLDRVEREHQE